MKKTVKVVMLSTEKAIYAGNDIFWYYTNQKVLYKDGFQQHLYLISDDEIKEGDWYYSPETKQVYNQSNHETSLPCRKIIATTDTSLFYDKPFRSNYGGSKATMLPQIPESFIQAYIKAYNEGKPITEVAVEVILEEYLQGTRQENHKILIKTRSDNTIIIHQAKMYTRDEVANLIRKMYYETTGKSTGHPDGACSRWIENNL
jgi:hypothetical protein